LQSKEIVLQVLDGATKARPRIERAASNGSSDVLFENIVARLDELLDRQLTALIESVRAAQVELEKGKILAEAV
jgi:hypothetical protein